MECTRFFVHLNAPRLDARQHHGRMDTKNRSVSRSSLEFGIPSRHKTIELLTEAIKRYIHYYNTRRTHSSLKMSRRAFCIQERKRFPTEPRAYEKKDTFHLNPEIVSRRNPDVFDR